MAPQPIRIGLIGAGGNMKSRHIPGFLKIKGVKLAAVANRSYSSGKKIADEFGVENGLRYLKTKRSTQFVLVHGHTCTRHFLLVRLTMVSMFYVKHGWQ